MLLKSGKTPADLRRSRRRRMLKTAADDRERVRQRQGGRCYALGVSPVCTGRMDDPHELIPVGIGGPRASWNRVGLCRTCHRAAQGRVGGNRLVLEWDGRQPNADQPGAVRVRWRGPKGDPLGL